MYYRRLKADSTLMHSKRTTPHNDKYKTTLFEACTLTTATTQMQHTYMYVLILQCGQLRCKTKTLMRTFTISLEQARVVHGSIE